MRSCSPTAKKIKGLSFLHNDLKLSDILFQYFKKVVKMHKIRNNMAGLTVASVITVGASWDS